MITFTADRALVNAPNLKVTWFVVAVAVALHRYAKSAQLHFLFDHSVRDGKSTSGQTTDNCGFWVVFFILSQLLLLVDGRALN